MNIANYGQTRDINATDGELQIFEYLRNVCPELELCRKADSYVTAVLGETDVARFKFTPKAKWIMFPYATAKIRITAPEDVNRMDYELKKAVDTAKEINNN